MKRSAKVVLGVCLLASSLGFAATSSKSNLLSELQETSQSPVANYIYSMDSMGDETVLISLLVEMKRQTEIQTQQLMETKKNNAILSEVMHKHEGSSTSTY